MPTNKDDEQILVIKSDIIFKTGKWQGLKQDNLDYYIDLIKKNSEFKRRGDMENDPSWQQIIPYILFNFEDPENNGASKYFLYKYLKKAGEQRLKNDYIIGVGGHINKEDVKGEKDILEAGRDREWDEEVEYKDKFLEKKLVGILADSRRMVESVHLGLVYVFKGSTPNISVKEIDKMAGQLFDLKDLAEKAENTEGWAPIIYNEYIIKNV
jgi:predicted NUDIX family phosphoesterase